MLKREQLDPLLSDKFFTPLTAPDQAVAVESQNENNHVPLSSIEVTSNFPFSLPSDKETIFHFMKLHGVEFTEGANGLINRLLVWTKKHDISFNAYNTFKREFNYKRYILDKFIYESYLQEECFDLFTEGLVTLKKIVDQLESDDCPEHAPIVIAKMFLGLSACGPGMNVRIQTAFNELNPNPAQMLMAIRVEIVHQVVRDIIAKNNHTLKINPIWEIHYGNAIGNRFRHQLGILYIQDENTPAKDKSFEMLAEMFAAEIHKILRAELVFDQLFLMSSLGFDKLLSDLPEKILEKGYVEKLENKLNQYGPDEFFSLNAFFDQDALSDGEFKLDKFASETLRFSLLRRLIASGFFGIKFETYKLQDGSTVFVCPQRELPFSFILTPEGQSYSLERKCKEEVDKGEFSLVKFFSDNYSEDLISDFYISLEKELLRIEELSKNEKEAVVNRFEMALGQTVFQAFLLDNDLSVLSLLFTLSSSDDFFVDAYPGLLRKGCQIVFERDGRPVSLPDFFYGFFQEKDNCTNDHIRFIFSLLKYTSQINHVENISSLLKIVTFNRSYLDDFFECFVHRLDKDMQNRVIDHFKQLYHEKPCANVMIWILLSFPLAQRISIFKSFEYNDLIKLNIEELTKLLFCLPKEEITNAAEFVNLEHMASLVNKFLDLYYVVNHVFDTEPQRIKFLRLFSTSRLQSLCLKMEHVNSFCLFRQENLEAFAQMLTTAYLLKMATLEDDHIQAQSMDIKFNYLKWILLSAQPYERLALLTSLAGHLQDANEELSSIRSHICQSFITVREVFLLLPKQDFLSAYEFLNQTICGQKPISQLVKNKVSCKMILDSKLSAHLDFIYDCPPLWRQLVIDLLEVFIKRKPSSYDRHRLFNKDTNSEVIAVKALLRVLHYKQPLSHLDSYQKQLEKIHPFIEYKTLIEPLLQSQAVITEITASQSTGMRLNNKN